MLYGKTKIAQHFVTDEYSSEYDRDREAKGCRNNTFVNDFQAKIRIGIINEISVPQ